MEVYRQVVNTHLCHDYSSFSIISGLDLGGSGYRQVVK